MKFAILSWISLAMLICIAEAQVPGQPDSLSAAQGGVGTAAGAGGQVGGAATLGEDGPGAGMSAGIAAGAEMGAKAQAGGAGAVDVDARSGTSV
ncbi:glycine-rich protein 1 [Drosophila elegans]|uniref:glycine-rich protein 1 n=1 Tax=Drosophila elegans TaxID=30023 RepID=UPI0007E6A6F2|nr:glycine-rich protein 1 [Drosophila elegans]